MKKKIDYVHYYLDYDDLKNNIGNVNISWLFDDYNSFFCDWFCDYIVFSDEYIKSAVEILHKNGKSVYPIFFNFDDFDFERFKSLGFDGVAFNFENLIERDRIDVIKKFSENGIKIRLYSCCLGHRELMNEIKDYVDIFIFVVSYLDFTRSIDEVIRLKNDLNLNVGLDIIDKLHWYNSEIFDDFDEDYQNNAYLWKLDYNDIINDDYVKNYCNSHPKDLEKKYENLLLSKSVYKCLDNDIITFGDEWLRNLLVYCVNCYNYNNNDISKDAAKIKVLEFDGKKFAAKDVKYSSIDFSKKYSSVSFKDVSKISSDGFNTLSYEKVEKDNNYGIDEKHYSEDSSLVGLKNYPIFYEEKSNTTNNDVNLIGADKLVFNADDDFDLSDNACLDGTLNNNVSDEDADVVEEDNSKKTIGVIGKFKTLFQRKDNTLDDDVNDLGDDITLIDDEEDTTDEDTDVVEEDNSKKSVGIIDKFITLFQRKDKTLDDDDLEDDITLIDDEEDTTDEDTDVVEEDNSKKSVVIIDKFITLFQRKDKTLDDDDLEDDITLIDDEENTTDEDTDVVEEDNSKKSVGIIGKFKTLFKRKDNTLDDNENDLENDIILSDDEEDTTDEDTYEVEEDNSKKSIGVIDKFITLFKRKDNTLDDNENDLEDDITLIDEEEDTTDEDTDVVEEDNSKKSVGLFGKLINRFRRKDNILDDNENDLGEDIALNYDEDTTDEDTDEVDEDNEKGSNEGIFTKIKNKVIQLLKRNDISDEEIESRKYRSDIGDDYIDINDYCPNIDEDNNNRLRIVSTKKSKNKTSLKKKIVAASIALGIVLSATVVGVCCFINNKDKDEDNLSNDSIVDDLTYDFSFIINDELTKKAIENYNNLHNKDVKEETNENKDNYQDVSNVSDNKQENNVFEIGDTVTVQAEYIYDNVYDAMNRTNGYNPYFENSKEREVKGVFVELNDSYSYYENQEDIDAALSDGGIVRSYVVGNSDGYEGAYNSLDVKSLQKVGNRL